MNWNNLQTRIHVHLSYFMLWIFKGGIFISMYFLSTAKVRLEYFNKKLSVINHTRMMYSWTNFSFHVFSFSHRLHTMHYAGKTIEWSEENWRKILILETVKWDSVCKWLTFRCFILIHLCMMVCRLFIVCTNFYQQSNYFQRQTPSCVVKTSRGFLRLSLCTRLTRGPWNRTFCRTEPNF